MRCKIVKEGCEGSNPDWDPKDPESPHSIAHPVGTVLEGADVWMHVVLGKAIPDDDECWKRVERRNPALVEKIRKKFPTAAAPKTDGAGEQSPEPPKPPKKPKGETPPPA